jgi:hypothetical protein
LHARGHEKYLALNIAGTERHEGHVVRAEIEDACVPVLAAILLVSAMKVWRHN